MCERFDWSNDPAIILTRRDAVAAYANAAGDIVVLQQQYPEDDACIVIPQQDAGTSARVSPRSRISPSPAASG